MVEEEASANYAAAAAASSIPTLPLQHNSSSSCSSNNNRKKKHSHDNNRTGQIRCLRSRMPTNTTGTSSSIPAAASSTDAAPSSCYSASTTDEQQKNKKRRLRFTFDVRFIGPPLPPHEAKQRWSHRYLHLSPAAAASGAASTATVSGDIDAAANPVENGRKSLKMISSADYTLSRSECVTHYARAEVDKGTYELGDFVTINSDGDIDYIGRIEELFETGDGGQWLTVQWMFRPDETVLGSVAAKHQDADVRRIFYSQENDVIPLETITSKIRVSHLSRRQLQEKAASSRRHGRFDCYYDMGYSYDYSTFYSLPIGSGSSGDHNSVKSAVVDNGNTAYGDLYLLDMYSGCGGLSAGLRMGAHLCSLNIVTRWAVDISEDACESFKLNHPQTEVRNEAAEDFLRLIGEWKRLCEKYAGAESVKAEERARDDGCGGEGEEEEEGELFEVEKVMGIRCVDATAGNRSGLEFKVHWTGYPEDEDSWEPMDALLESCEDQLRAFVLEGRKQKILPLPGEVDIICGGPPCQGITGLNRFRNTRTPLKDPKNQQTTVFMDIVEFLKPRFVILENVVDILRFCDGYLARYAISRLVQMRYQAKFGLLVAGCYGLPQFRMRFFLLGASPSEVLPAFPLPTHDVLMRGSKPADWERNIVAYDENSQPKLNDAVLLQDAISDLPPVKNLEKREVIRYARPPLTQFQKFIRSPINGEDAARKTPKLVRDHRPLVLNHDDFERMSKIPKRKGANFTDLPGIKKRRDGIVSVDPKRIFVLPSGKQLVPQYVLNSAQTRPNPFGRVWWDEIVPTVTTRPTPYARRMIHPTQDRVLSVRECARVQGFPDDYQFSGPVKERYRQIGNAVAVPVAKALGYTLGLAVKREYTNKADLELPLDFAFRSSSAELGMEMSTFERRKLRPRKLEYT